MVGVSAYRDFSPFVANVTDGLGWMSGIATVWAYLLPGLLILGGGTLALGRYSVAAAYTGGIALGSIPVGLLLKNVMTGVPLPDMMAAAYPIVVLMLAFYFAVNKMPDMEEQVTALEE